MIVYFRKQQRISYDRSIRFQKAFLKTIPLCFHTQLYYNSVQKWRYAVDQTDYTKQERMKYSL